MAVWWSFKSYSFHTHQMDNITKNETIPKSHTCLKCILSQGYNKIQKGLYVAHTWGKGGWDLLSQSLLNSSYFSVTS